MAESGAVGHLLFLSVRWLCHDFERQNSRGAQTTPQVLFRQHSNCDSGKINAIRVKQTSHDEFYQIEDTLFNVHKYQLMKSETFSDMFKIGGESDQEDVEGSSPKNPIVMSGVTASDFEALLTVLYAT